MRRYLVSAATAAMASLGVALAAAAQDKAAQTSPAAAAGTTGEPCHVAGVSDIVRCSRLPVPLDRSKPDGDSIEIFYVTVPSNAAQPAADPLFILAGGPGQAASEMGALIGVAFSEIRESRDIVLMDRRGTGRSHPLDCELFTEDEVRIDPSVLARRAGRCQAESGIDTRRFTAEDVMHDIDAVRDAVGAETISLWGGSYGTRAGLLYMRAYPDRVRAAILDGVIGPEIRLFEAAPKASHAAFMAWAAQMPGMADSLRDLLARHAAPARYDSRDPMTGERRDIPVGRDMLALTVRGTLYSPTTARTLPVGLAALEAGDPAPLMAAGSALGDVSASMYLGATLATLCPEEIARLSPEEARRAGEDTVFGDSFYRMFSAACRGWRIDPASAEYGARVASDIPTLLLSGARDPVTPPSHAESAAEGLSRARHIVVEGGGHIVSPLGCMPGLIADFLDTADPDTLKTDCVADIPVRGVVTDTLGPDL